MGSTGTSHLTAAFVDLCGFSAYTERRGDQAARDVVVLMQRVIRHHARQSNVRVVTWTGDGCLLVGKECMAVNAMVRRCIAELAAVLPLRARAGMATGPVVTFGDGEVVGATVNLAARRCAAAEPGEVLTSRRSRQELPRVAPLAACPPSDRRHVTPTVREVSSVP